MKYDKKIWMSQSVENIASDKPIIFWDTCALLDILRIPYRSGKINDLNLYEKVLDGIKNGAVISVTSEIVAEEFDRHFNDMYDELEKEQENRKKGVKDFAIFEKDEATRVNISTVIDTLSVSQRLLDVVDQICNNTIQIRGDANQCKFADFRLRNSIAPAAKKNEYKDCYIWGAFITLAQNLEHHNSMIFFTSNIDDYIDKSSKDFYSQLKNDCRNANGKIEISIGNLYGSLHRAGII